MSFTQENAADLHSVVNVNDLYICDYDRRKSCQKYYSLSLFDRLSTGRLFKGFPCSDNCQGNLQTLQSPTTL